MHHQFAVMRVPHGWLLRQTMPIQYSSFLHHKPQLFNFVVHGAPHARLSLFFLTPSLPRSLALSLSLVHVHSSTIPPSGSLARSLAGSSSGRRRCFARSLEVPRRWSSVFGLAPLPAPPNKRTNGACGCQSHLPILHKLHPRRPSPSPCKFETSLAVGPFHLTAPGT